MKDSEIDLIYDFADAQMSKGRFRFLGSVLDGVYFEVKSGDIDIEEVITWLTVTLPAKNKIKTREWLYDAAVQRWGNQSDLFTGLK